MNDTCKPLPRRPALHLGARTQMALRGFGARSMMFETLLPALLVAVGCALPNVPDQPDRGRRLDYPTQAAVLRSLPVYVQPGITSPTARVNVYSDGMVALSGVPWYHQGDDRTCAQANIATLLAYWGRPMPYAAVVREMNPGNLPTDVRAVTDYLRRKGVASQDYRQATLNYLKDRINAGRPVLVLLDYGSLASTHYVTVKGYDDRREQLLVNDPIEGPNMLFPYRTFEAMWRNDSLSRLPGLQGRYVRIAFDSGPAAAADDTGRRAPGNSSPDPSPSSPQGETG